MFIVLWIAALLISSPLWIPLLFVAYAVGRRQFSLKLLLGLITAEAFALAAMMAGLRQLID